MILLSGTWDEHVAYLEQSATIEINYTGWTDYFLGIQLFLIHE